VAYLELRLLNYSNLQDLFVALQPFEQIEQYLQLGQHTMLVFCQISGSREVRLRGFGTNSVPSQSMAIPRIEQLVDFVPVPLALEQRCLPLMPMSLHRR
jgi:hypothetical protein